MSCRKIIARPTTDTVQTPVRSLAIAYSALHLETLDYQIARLAGVDSVMLYAHGAVMKTIRILLVLILGLSISLPALAGGKRGGGGYRGGGGHHGSHHHHYRGTRWFVGVNVGYPGWGWPYYGYSAWSYPYYPYPYYPAYYPGPVVQQPTTYVEQPAPQAQQQAPTGYWYYCAEPGAYYPYIKECPAGWQRVAPQPGN